MIDVPYSTIALKIGNILFSSMVAVGVISGLFMIPSDLLHSIVRQQFSSKSEDIIGKNLEASREGLSDRARPMSVGKNSNRYFQ